MILLPTRHGPVWLDEEDWEWLSTLPIVIKSRLNRVGKPWAYASVWDAEGNSVAYPLGKLLHWMEPGRSGGTGLAEVGVWHLNGDGLDYRRANLWVGVKREFQRSRKVSKDE